MVFYGFLVYFAVFLGFYSGFIYCFNGLSAVRSPNKLGDSSCVSLTFPPKAFSEGVVRSSQDRNRIKMTLSICFFVLFLFCFYVVF